MIGEPSALFPKKYLKSTIGYRRKRMCQCEQLCRKIAEELVSCISRKHVCPDKEKIISCKENKNSFKCKIAQSEIGILFTIDPSYNGNCRPEREGKDCWSSKNSCDFFLYFENDSLKSVTFIELKGSDLNHAIMQLKESIREFRRQFPKKQWDYKIFAAIIYSGSAPRQIKDKELKNLLDKFPYFRQRQYGDITKYIKTL